MLVAVAVGMAAMPRGEGTFTGGVLVYALMCGFAYAAFSALFLYAIGRGLLQRNTRFYHQPGTSR